MGVEMGTHGNGNIIWEYNGIENLRSTRDNGSGNGYLYLIPEFPFVREIM